jgi:hypothetical protein
MEFKRIIRNKTYDYDLSLKKINILNLKYLFFLMINHNHSDHVKNMSNF